MIPIEVHQHIEALHQPQILTYWESLSNPEKQSLVRQIEMIDENLLEKLRGVIGKEISGQKTIKPLKQYLVSGSKENRAIGHELIAKGKVGCLIMAGGMGTRLKFDGPKGMYPLSQFKKKTPFQLFAERIKAAEKLYGCELPVTVMTSSLNDQVTREFFQQHERFGLSEEQLDFFMQGNLPFLSQQGDLFLDAPGHIAEGPNGNGELLHFFFRSGIWQKWKDQGVDYVNIVLIDNPLADPFDAELIGTQFVEGCDLLVKGTEREDPKERVGVLVRIGDQVHVVEYSEMKPEDMEAVAPSGELAYPCANLSLFSVTMDFIERAQESDLPIHRAFKALPFLDSTGALVHPERPNAWKFEKFIFDVFPYGNVAVILYPREDCFAPLKNKEGKDSPEAVLQAIQNFDRRVFEKISGLPPSNRPFELDPEFYYPTPDLIETWKGRELPNLNYINP